MHFWSEMRWIWQEGRGNTTQTKPSRKHRASLGGKEQAEVVQNPCSSCVTPHKFIGFHWDFIPVINTQQWIVANWKNHGSYCFRKRKMQRVFVDLRITMKTDHSVIPNRHLLVSWGLYIWTLTCLSIRLCKIISGLWDYIQNVCVQNFWASILSWINTPALCLLLRVTDFI